MSTYNLGFLALDSGWAALRHESPGTPLKTWHRIVRGLRQRQIEYWDMMMDENSIHNAKRYPEMPDRSSVNARSHARELQCPKLKSNKTRSKNKPRIPNRDANPLKAPSPML